MRSSEPGVSVVVAIQASGAPGRRAFVVRRNMQTTTKCHIEIILHESRVIAIDDQVESIILHLQVATLSPKHPANHSGCFLDLRPAELKLCPVRSTCVDLWNDALKSFERSNERIPSGLTEIYEPERPIIEPDGCLMWIVNGFDAISGRWLEWRVRAEAFELSWNTEEKRK